MKRYVLRRVALSLITLLLLVTIVFVIVNVLPDDPGRRIAGPFAPQETVDLINERLGSNDPVPVQYARLLRNTVTFDFGDSFQFNRPVGDVLWPALWRSGSDLLCAEQLLVIHCTIRGNGRTSGCGGGAFAFKSPMIAIRKPPRWVGSSWFSISRAADRRKLAG